MRRLRFCDHAGLYNAGEVAGVPDHLAALYVRSGKAHYDDEPSPEAPTPAVAAVDDEPAAVPAADDSGKSRRRRT